MKTSILFTGILVASLLLTQLSYSQVTSDYDKNADFSKYKTYSIAGWENDSDKILNEFDKKRITDALTSEFESRGMQLVESNGDAAITLYIVVDNKTSTTAYTSYNGGMGYRGGWGYGMGNTTTTYSEDDYREGTMVIDMYDEESKNLVWQGVMQTEVQENPQKREKTIPKKMKKLMKQFPALPNQ